MPGGADILALGTHDIDCTGRTVAPLPKPSARTIGRGTQAGVVRRLDNGSLVDVQQAPGAKKSP